MKTLTRSEHEERLRLLALRILDSEGDEPAARRRVAQVMGVTERTVRRWAQRVRAGEPAASTPGRRPAEVPRRKRQRLIGWLLRLGPFAGVNVLRRLCSAVPYRQIAAMKRRFSRVIRRRRGWYQKRLKWTRAGAVWATDFTKPKARLPGRANRLFLVRDLASGFQLAAVPCRGERASAACAILLTLFLAVGPPLVLKTDNGGAFIAHETQALLGGHGVTQLRSPIRTPQYNGACERAGGCVKRRVEHEAVIAGRPRVWTSADVDQALWIANTTARPNGANGPTPAESFAARAPIAAQERQAFKRTCARNVARALQTHEAEFGTMPTCSKRASIDRKAIQDALSEHGYLKFRRGRLSTLVSAWKADREA